MVTLIDVNPEQRVRWKEIIGEPNSCMIIDAEHDDIDPDILVLHLDPDDAERLGIYMFLWMTKDGRVSEAMAHNPLCYDSFAALLCAVEDRGIPT